MYHYTIYRVIYSCHWARFLELTDFQLYILFIFFSNNITDIIVEKTLCTVITLSNSILFLNTTKYHWKLSF